jgi:hypothetical protein
MKKFKNKIVNSLLMSVAVLALSACGSEEFFEGTYINAVDLETRLVLTSDSVKLIGRKDRVKIDADFQLIKAVAPLEAYSSGSLSIEFDKEGETTKWPLKFLNKDIIGLGEEMFIREDADFKSHVVQYFGEYSFKEKSEKVSVIFNEKTLTMMSQVNNKKAREKIIEYTQAFPVEIENKKMIILKNGKQGGVAMFEYGDDYITLNNFKMLKN